LIFGQNLAEVSGKATGFRIVGGIVMTKAPEAVTALKLEQETPLSDAMQTYFAKCEEKLGMVPNVLKAYAFNTDKLEAFAGFYNDLMLAGSGLSKLRGS
jgi:alkylhydroperoxidase family enzyme